MSTENKALERAYEALQVASKNFNANLSHILVGEALFFYALEKESRPSVRLIVDMSYNPSMFRLVMNETLVFGDANPKELKKGHVNAILLSTKDARKSKSITLSLSDSHPSKERLLELFKAHPGYDKLEITASYSATY